MPLSALAPDQRAVVQLVLQRERSYAQIAELLKISEDAVRARAHAGLAALAPDVELPADKLAQISDFLLGQQNGKPRQATRRLLRSANGAAREWAEAVRSQLEEVGGALPALPPPTGTAKAAAKTPADVAEPAAVEAPDAPAPEPEPAPTSEMPAPRPRPLRDAPRTHSGAGPAVGPSAAAGVAAASSRRGGAVLLIGLAVLAIVVVVLVLFVFKSDDNSPSSPASAKATPTATASATPAPVGQLTLKGTSAAPKAKGVLALFLQDQQKLVFALQVQGMPPTPKGAKYALWLSGGSKPTWLGDVPTVGKNGVLQVQGPGQQDTTFEKTFAAHRRVLITLQPGSSRKRPGPTLVRGTLPRRSS
jgi:hypothetical protein